MTDTLTVYLSGNALDGDAEATVSVNGTQVGGTLDVSAVNAADNVQAFTFTGNFGANPQVALTFVNQDSISSSQYRALYLDGFTYDGVPQLNDKNELTYDQVDTYTLSSAPSVAERAASFLNAIGVTVHEDYLDTSYGTANGQEPNFPLITSDLSYLGISTIRVSAPTTETLPWLETLASDGTKFDVQMPLASSPSLLPGQLAEIDAIAPSVIAIEGPNEINISAGFSWNGQTGSAAAVAYQQALWNAVEGDPNLSKDAVYNFTLGSFGPSDVSALGNVSPCVTDGNVHVYYANGTSPAATLQWALATISPATTGRPMVITESNYATAPLLQNGVSTAVQASYDLDLLMDATKDGAAATYFYELLDEVADPNDTTSNENHFGLFNADGTPKPVATDLHNLTSILTDLGSTAGTFTTGSLAYSVSGLPASGNSLLLEKSNGAYDVVVWAEPEIWNATTDSQVAATPRQVQVTLADSAAVNVYDPLTGTPAIARYASTTSVTVTVTDHPVIIEVEPTPAVTFTDVNNSTDTIQPITSATTTLATSTSGLDNPVTMAVSQGVVDISTPVWNGVKTIALSDFATTDSYDLSNFVETDVALAGASNGSLVINSAKRGTITLASGNYNVQVNAYSNEPDSGTYSNGFTLDVGTGTDTLTVDGYLADTYATFNAGSGSAKMVFVGAGAATFNAGSGAAQIYTGSGAGKVTFGSGTATVWCGNGPDTFIFHAEDGLQTINGFGAGSGKVLEFDSSLKSSLTEAVTGGNTTLSIDSTQGVVLTGVTNFNMSAIHWI